MFPGARGRRWPIPIMAGTAISIRPGATSARRRAAWRRRWPRRKRYEPEAALPSAFVLLLEGSDRALRERHAVRARPARKSRRSGDARRPDCLVAAGEDPAARGRGARRDRARDDDHDRLSRPPLSGAGPVRSGRRRCRARDEAVGSGVRPARASADAEDRRRQAAARGSARPVRRGRGAPVAGDRARYRRECRGAAAMGGRRRIRPGGLRGAAGAVLRRQGHAVRKRSSERDGAARPAEGTAERGAGARRGRALFPIFPGRMSAFSERVAELTGAGEEAMERLAGGDVSGTLRVTRPEGGTVVAKGGMTAVEAMMLRRLAEAGVPVPPIEGEYDGVLLLGFVENDELFSPRAWADLGAVLRRLHGHSGEDYGWPVDFAAGSVLISNRPSSDWGQFWADERLLAPAALLDRPWRERVAAARPPADADWGLAERVALDDRIDRAFGRQRAFEQGEVGDLEGRAGKASRSFEQIADMARTALEASERDVGKIGALIGRDADPGERGIDLLVQGFERLVRRDAGPARLRLAAPLERADARQRDREGGWGIVPSAA